MNGWLIWLPLPKEYLSNRVNPQKIFFLFSTSKLLSIFALYIGEEIHFKSVLAHLKSKIFSIGQRWWPTFFHTWNVLKSHIRSGSASDFVLKNAELLLVDTTGFNADRADKFINEINRGKHKTTSNEQKNNKQYQEDIIDKTADVSATLSQRKLF